MAAGGPQMLATSNVCGVDAAVRHVLWCVVLQTSDSAFERHLKQHLESYRIRDSKPRAP